ncbi:hypothetical protein NJB14197_45940 [Mycobacterium montefiorense]|nr:hypothetical protein NJB14191_36390 [Mycobacterium montefiorense]GKU42820.1 hypothetical protein NJB14192_48030 [Mycobacterium montefiorense]GKU46494.1 hypothetical protein NJB14194_31120 [Mycobacterium montefiorense]GKU53626.1 hypothetical protein NJB14195_48670 [Mycobacterium montefiorense]GKU58734.1 hypothetical protein NJB14197_45940 [Mycobacterium montefiorense]
MPSSAAGGPDVALGGGSAAAGAGALDGTLAARAAVDSIFRPVMMPKANSPISTAIATAPITILRGLRFAGPP